MRLPLVSLLIIVVSAQASGAEKSSEHPSLAYVQNSSLNPVDVFIKNGTAVGDSRGLAFTQTLLGGDLRCRVLVTKHGVTRRGDGDKLPTILLNVVGPTKDMQRGASITREVGSIDLFKSEVDLALLTLELKPDDLGCPFKQPALPRPSTSGYYVRVINEHAQSFRRVQSIDVNEVNNDLASGISLPPMERGDSGSSVWRDGRRVGIFFGTTGQKQATEKIVNFIPARRVVELLRPLNIELFKPLRGVGDIVRDQCTRCIPLEMVVVKEASIDKKGLMIARTEVSALQWAPCEVAGEPETACPIRRRIIRTKSQPPEQVGLKPKGSVTIEDAIRFARWRTRVANLRVYRLPTKEEWISAYKVWWSRQPGGHQICQVANLADASMKREYRNYRGLDCFDGHVRSRGYNPDEAPSGSAPLQDMLGNVWEWTETCYRHKDEVEEVTKGQGECQRYYIMGGAWNTNLRWAQRDAPLEPPWDYQPGNKPRGTIGFRLVREFSIDE